MGPTSVEFETDLTSALLVGSEAHTSSSVMPVVSRPDQGLHILLATTGQLPSTARLAIELHDAGARVSLISPRNHPARVLDLIGDQLVYRAVDPERCLEASVLRLRPDIVIPCDERAVRHLHAVCRKTHDPEVKRLIQLSTSPVENFHIITSRAELLELARREGVRVPPSVSLPDHHALDQWIAGHSAPYVLKADGSWAGLGVRICPDAASARDALTQMTKPAGARLGFREAVLEGNHFYIRPWLKRERPAMSVQGHIDGWPANIGVACWQGEVLGTICAKAVATVSATGASTSVRIIDNPEMVDTARRIVAALHLSGLIGFDFMIEAATGTAWLIEMNPRNTPVCALRLGPGRDLAEALVARLGGRKMRDRPSRAHGDIVVFFPDTWQEDPSSALLHSAYHDVPWEYPALVRAMMKPERRERYWVFRTLRRLWLTLHPPDDKQS